MDAQSARTSFDEPDHTDRPALISTTSGRTVPAHRSPALVLSDLTDDDLAAAAAAGDQEAFGVLVERLLPGLLRYLRRMIADPQIAEDLAQETLLHTWKGLPQFAFRSSFRTWMFAIAHRKTVDHHRRRRDIPTVADRFAELADPAPPPAAQAEQASLVEALRRELSALPATSRATWWLREVEGLSLAEIARVLQISVGSVRGHLQRSRRSLALRLAPWRPPKEDQSG